MMLLISRDLAQAIVDHITSSPTGPASWSATNEIVQALLQLKPATEKPTYAVDEERPDADSAGE